MKKFIRDTYGSGTHFTFFGALGVLVGGLCFSALILIGANCIANSLPDIINQIIFAYISGFVASSALLIFALYFYCKAIPIKDPFKFLKIIFMGLSAFVFAIFIFPCFLVRVVISFIGEKLGTTESIKTIDQIINGILCLVIWPLLTLVGFWILLFAFELIPFLDFKAIVFYSLFCSLMLSNGITKRVYFRFSKADTVERKKALQHDISILWTLVVLLTSALLKPLDFGDESLNILRDAFFYSTSTLSLASSLVKLQQTKPN